MVLRDIKGVTCENPLTLNELGLVASMETQLDCGSGFHTVVPGHSLPDLELAN